VTPRPPAALVAVCTALVFGAGASAAPPQLPGPPATAQARAVEILAPDQSQTAATELLAAPPAAGIAPAPFVYPDDGSVVSAESASASVSASGADGTAAAFTGVTKLSLFGGEITADGVKASVSSAGTIGDISDSAVTNLVVLGQPVAAVTPGLELPLADWGSLVLLGQTTKQGPGAAPFWHGTIAALVVRLAADHGGLSAGTTIRIGFADAYARPPASAATSTAGTTTTAPAAGRASGPKAPARKGLLAPLHGLLGGGEALRAPSAGRQAKAKTKARNGGLPVFATVPDVTPKLTAGRYVFPVYGPSGYGDTFGAPRADVSGGWHHGDDVFAPLGAPVLAVADGTVFSVGWNDVGGWRLWLRDRAGNEFYYAHLSAYTALAVDGRRVQAGQVLGFVGNTGDAEGTPFHLHFEVHPVSLLFLQYDGAVNPTPYLDAWKRLEDVRILPAVPFAVPGSGASRAPPPGAILLESADISTANGLDPGSLTRAMNAPATFDVTAPRVAELPIPLPVLDRA
jgi:murein DD-endopeptidase MepM/ murein hydrolase activator NlpD